MSMSDTPDDLAKSVGYALSAWATIEASLAGLFVVVAEIPNTMKADAICDATISFNARLDMCHALMAREGLEESEQKHWNDVKKALNKQYTKRNQLAHFVIVTTGVSPEPMETFVAPFFSTRRYFGKKLDLLSVSQIEETRKMFLGLNEAVVWFTKMAFFRKGLLGDTPPSQPSILHNLSSAVDRP